MKLYCRFIKTLLFAVLVVNASCADNQDKMEEEMISVEVEIISELEKLVVEIDALIGEATCDDSTQCGYIEIGSKPCGGPASFKIYSTINTDTTLLFEKSQEHANLSNEYNILLGLGSDCSIEEPPLVICESKCIAVY